MKFFSISIFAFLCLCICAVSCDKNEGEWSRLGFDKCIKVGLTDTNISDHDLGTPEMISVNDSTLVLLDVFENTIFSSFDLKSGKLLQRFGTIGNGPKEILVGSIGNLRNDEYIVYDLQSGSIVKFNPEEGDSSYTRLRTDIPKNVFISRIAVPDDTTAVMMGTYNDRYKYAVFNQYGIVKDSLCVINGADNPNLNNSHRFLAEQGEMTMNPSKTRIASTTNYSDNIGFIDITDGRLKVIRELNMRNPEFSPVSMGQGISRILPSSEEPIGFLRLTSNSNNVFALYSKQTLEEGGYYGQYILCYDWNGTPLVVLDTDEQIFAIGVNEKTLYAVTMDADGKYKLQQIDLEKISKLL